MALLVRSTNLARGGLETIQGMIAPKLSGNFHAGEDLNPIAPCYIAAADGLIYQCDNAAADEKAVVAGWTATSYRTGETVTLYGVGAIFHFSDALLTPGQLVYMGTAGELDDAAGTGHPDPIAQAINASEIRVVVNS